MAETTFGALITQNSANVRKGLTGGVLIAPMSASLPTSLTIDSAETPGTPVLQTLTGFSSLGYFTDAGAIFSDAETDSTITPWGSLDPVRRDITSAVTTLHVVGLETNKQTIAAYLAADPSTLTPDATTAELHVDKSASPIAVYNRIILLSQDGAAGSEYWMGKILPRASVTTHGDQTFAEGDTPIEWDMTFTAFKDAAAGYSVRNFFAGPGWKTNKTGAGF